MDVLAATTDAPLATGADTVVIGLFEGEGIAHDVEGGALQALVEAGEAKPGFRKLALWHAEGVRWLVVGLGAREAFDPERARVAAAVAHGRARELGARRVCWEVPHKVTDAHVAALVEGTVMAGYRYTAWKSAADDEDGAGLEWLVLSAHHDVDEASRRGAAAGRAANAARDLQNAPANEMTPTRLAERAREIEGVSVSVMGRAELVEAGMGAFAAVAQGTEEEPQLITIRYDGPGATGPLLGFVGKAVTFDSGGISIKPGAKMSEMKFDMSGGAAVLAATEAIAGEQLPVRLIAVIGATENLPSGRAYKPGDILRASNGVTIEVINTDAEGRLVLADCLAHAVREGAERLVDVATLTGAITSALGSTYAGIVSDDDDWCARVEAAGRASGEIVWRLPLHPEYADLIKSRYADIMNAVESRKAGSITAAEFLNRFTGGVPWAHLDIAGTAWDTGRAYAPKAGNGMATRLLLELARAHAA
ncbi:MAG TPA: leucyl aminopeptidase [Solirubrobacteraceae bacterium]